MAGTQYKGTGKLKLNGMLLGTVPNTIEITYSGMQRETIIVDGIMHFKETPMPGMIEAEFLFTDVFPLKAVNELVNGIIEVEFDTGFRHEMTGALRVGDPISSSTNTGRVKAQFSGTINLT